MDAELKTSGIQSWKTLERHTILDHSKYLAVESHTIKLPDGRVIDDWPWLIIPSGVQVLAVTEDKKFILLRQTKYAVDGISLATVSGYLEPGEAPLAAAQRELLEETGYRASRWIDLGHYITDGNRGAGVSYLFLALEACCVAEPDSDDLEKPQLLRLSLQELETALAAGEFKALPWAATVALALHRVTSLIK